MRLCGGHADSCSFLQRALLEELCDLLVVYDTTAILFQIKNLKLGKDGRYKPSKIDKNVRQLHGAHRRLLDIDRPLTLINPRRGSETFDPATVWSGCHLE